MTDHDNSRREIGIVGKIKGEQRLTPTARGTAIDLRTLGIELRVSEAACREISRVEARASRVMATSANFAFR